MKSVLTVSIVVNALLISFLMFVFSEKTSIENALVGMSQQIDQERIATADLLARLVVRRITKEDLMTVLRTSYPKERYNEKPQENAVVFGSLFFTFDAKDQLTAVETSAIEARKPKSEM